MFWLGRKLKNWCGFACFFFGFFYHLLSEKCHINYDEDLCLIEYLLFLIECSIRCRPDWWRGFDLLRLLIPEYRNSGVWDQQPDILHIHTQAGSCAHTNTAYNRVYPHTESEHHCKSSFFTAWGWNIVYVECQWGPVLCEYSCTVSKENSVHSVPTPCRTMKMLITFQK